MAAYCRQRDFLFCDKCGTMLSFYSRKRAKCPLCGCTRHVKEFVGKEISYSVNAEGIRRNLNIEPYIKLDGPNFEGIKFNKQTTEETCPQCQNKIAEYIARQLRSADEGQTITYTCVRCSHSWTQNT